MASLYSFFALFTMSSLVEAHLLPSAMLLIINCMLLTEVSTVVVEVSATSSHCSFWRMGSPVHLAVTTHLPLSHLSSPCALGSLRSLKHVKPVHTAPPIVPAHCFTESALMLLGTVGASLQGGVPSATLMPPIHRGFAVERAHNCL